VDKRIFVVDSTIKIKKLMEHWYHWCSATQTKNSY